jgi:hypothetical protein
MEKFLASKNHGHVDFCELILTKDGRVIYKDAWAIINLGIFFEGEWETIGNNPYRIEYLKKFDLNEESTAKLINNY